MPTARPEATPPTDALARFWRVLVVLLLLAFSALLLLLSGIDLSEAPEGIPAGLVVPGTAGAAPLP